MYQKAEPDKMTNTDPVKPTGKIRPLESRAPSDNPRSQTKVEGQKIESIYANFHGSKYWVNRRYQRKLVWSGEQKEKLIDSIVNNIPIPLILLARAEKAQDTYEIIDGLQRINAIATFIENEYTLNGKYFNLDAWGLTKLLKDQGTLRQREPKLSQEESVMISGYTIPVSTYESSSSTQVDETFRRINSSGRKLGMQEIRQAGSTSNIADLVRNISASIRGDVSRSDVITVREMQSNSLKWRNEEKSAGILVDDVYWVREGILRRDDLRSSTDEQLILDLLLDILLDLKENSSTNDRDAAYDPNSELHSRLQAAINSFAGVDDLPSQFKSVLELMTEIAHNGDNDRISWTLHTGKKTSNPSGRYFHIAFLALYRLIYLDKQKPSDLDYITDATRGYWRKLSLDTGGNWTSEAKKSAVNQFIGAIQSGFSPDDSAEDRAAREDIERLRSDFLRYSSENRFFELKTGLLEISEKSSGSISLKSRRPFFEKILKTATAMANTHSSAEGVIYIGIADNDKTAARIEKVFGVEPLSLGDKAKPIPHSIIGISHEFPILNVDLDQVLLTLKEWTLHSPMITDESWKKSLANSIRSVLIRDSHGEGRYLIAIHPKAGTLPVAYDERYFERIGSSNHVVKEQPILNPFERYEQFSYRNA